MHPLRCSLSQPYAFSTPLILPALPLSLSLLLLLLLLPLPCSSPALRLSPLLHLIPASPLSAPCSLSQLYPPLLPPFPVSHLSQILYCQSRGSAQASFLPLGLYTFTVTYTESRDALASIPQDMKTVREPLQLSQLLPLLLQLLLLSTLLLLLLLLLLVCLWIFVCAFICS